jgi:hypothetical protein
MSRSFRVGASIVASCALLAATDVARAQQYLPAATAQVASGVESAGRGIQRARTRVRVGLELRVDEAPDDALAGAVLVDVEPHAAAGFDLRYVRALGSSFAVNAGGVGYLAPGTLLGGCGGAEARISVAERTFVTLGPEMTVFFVGSDLPNNAIVWQGLVQAGLRVDL